MWPVLAEQKAEWLQGAGHLTVFCWAVAPLSSTRTIMEKWTSDSGVVQAQEP